MKSVVSLLYTFIRLFLNKRAHCPFFLLLKKKDLVRLCTHGNGRELTVSTSFLVSDFAGGSLSMGCSVGAKVSTSSKANVVEGAVVSSMGSLLSHTMRSSRLSSLLPELQSMVYLRRTGGFLCFGKDTLTGLFGGGLFGGGLFGGGLFSGRLVSERDGVEGLAD